MPNAVDFDTYAEQFGGAIHLDFATQKPDTFSLYLSGYLQFINALSKQGLKNKRNETLSLQSGVTVELDSEAFAQRLGGRHYIGMSIGHFFSSVYLSSELFYRTRLFPNFGESPLLGGAVQEATSIGLAIDGSFWTEHAHVVGERILGVDVGDKTRVNYMLFLNYVMSILALHHELYHVVQGHCSVLNKLGLSGLVTEAKPYNIDPLYYKIAKKFELSADHASMTLLIRMILSDSDIHTATGKVNIPQRDRVRLAIIGAGLVSSSWFTLQQRSKISDKCHPDPRARFINFCMAARPELQTVQSAEFDDVIQLSIDDLASICVICNDLKIALDGINGGSFVDANDIDFEQNLPENVCELLDEEKYYY